MKIIIIANCIKNFEYFTSFQAFDLNAFRSLKFVQIYYQIKCKIEIDSGVIDLSEIPNSRTTHVMS